MVVAADKIQGVRQSFIRGVNCETIHVVGILSTCFEFFTIINLIMQILVSFIRFPNTVFSSGWNTNISLFCHWEWNMIKYSDVIIGRLDVYHHPILIYKNNLQSRCIVKYSHALQNETAYVSTWWKTAKLAFLSPKTEKDKGKVAYTSCRISSICYEKARCRQ